MCEYLSKIKLISSTEVKEHGFSFLFQVRDAGNLLTRAGFSLPGVDVDEYVVKYKSGNNTSSLV